jgi:DsbC/DsbD-like thiol-disulfide interchange protein
MRIPLGAIVAAAFLCGASLQAPAADTGANPQDLVRASLEADVAAATPGGSFTLGIRLKMKEHWHTYWVNPGETGEATRIQVSGPAGFEFGAVQWPVPRRFDVDGASAYGYEDEVLLMIPVKVSQVAAGHGGQAAIHAEVTWLSCKEECVEGSAKLAIQLDMAHAPKPGTAAAEFARWKSRLPVGLDHPSASQAIAGVEQTMAKDGSPAAGLTVTWKQPPVKVEWYPVSTEAVAIEDVKVVHEAGVSRIAYKPNVFNAQAIAAGRVEGVLVFEDSHGRRTGVWTPIRVMK